MSILFRSDLVDFAVQEDHHCGENHCVRKCVSPACIASLVRVMLWC